jgi:hypothetical protein
VERQSSSQLVRRRGKGSGLSRAPVMTLAGALVVFDVRSSQDFARKRPYAVDHDDHVAND